MTNAWEVTVDDIEHVLSEHSKSFAIADDILINLDYGRVEKAILHYADMGDQADCAYSEIEDILIEDKHLDGPKLFHCP